VVLSREVYNDLLKALEHPAGHIHMPDAQQQQVTPSLPAADSACDVVKIHLDFDRRFVPKSEELRAKLGRQPYPTYEQLYFLIVNKPYDPSNNIWNTFPNPYRLNESFRFAFSNLRETHVRNVLGMLGKRPAFMVEVGSFHGHSAILQARVLDQLGFEETPLLCIDPWTGDLGMLLYRDDWDKKLTPGELADGRSTSYWQFMINVHSQVRQGLIKPKHILPLAVTAVVGARFLAALALTPDVIYLDSAHEVDETFTELTLFYHVLAAGGVIFGDDFSWDSVQHDVKRFSSMKGLELKTDGVTWMLQKPR